MALPRLFVALDLPERVRSDLEGALDPWRDRLVGARWAPPGNWHVTLHFLGATQESGIPGIEERLAGAARVARSFETSLTTLGGFPSATRARIVWAGLDDRAGRMGALARSVREVLDAEPEDRPFAAHVTVARNDRPRPLPEGFAATPVPASAFTVRELVLYRSHLGRPAPRYEALARFGLAGAGPR